MGMTPNQERCPVCNTPDELVGNLLVRICRSCIDEYSSGFDESPNEAEPDHQRYK